MCFALAALCGLHCFSFSKVVAPTIQPISVLEAFGILSALLVGSTRLLFLDGPAEAAAHLTALKYQRFLPHLFSCSLSPLLAAFSVAL